MRAGSKNVYAQEIYYTDLTAGSETVSGKGGWIVTESWSSEYHLVDLERTGSVFIAVSFAVLVFGVFLEYNTRRLRSRWTHRLALKVNDLEADMRKSDARNTGKP